MTGSDVLPWFGPINNLREYGAEIGQALPHISVSERNKMMVWNFLAGMSPADIARREDLTRARVYQIIRKTARKSLVWRSNFGDRPEDADGFAAATTLRGKLRHVSLAYLPLSVRAQNALQHHEFRTVGDIWLLDSRELYMPNLGTKTVYEIIGLRAEVAGVVNQCKTLEQFQNVWLNPDAVKRATPIYPVPANPKPMEILGHCPVGIAHGKVIPHEGSFFCECRCGWCGPLRKTRDKAILAWRTRA